MAAAQREYLKNLTKDMEECKVVKRTNKKLSGVYDIKILDNLSNSNRLRSPAAQLVARGIQFSIKEIPKNTTLRGRAVPQARDTSYETDMLNSREIVVPSFGAAGALFARHFDILRNLKRRINLLQQAFIN